MASTSNIKNVIAEPGWHDAESVSSLLGVKKNFLLKRLREETWLLNDPVNGIHGGKHNQPAPYFESIGLLKTQTREYKLKGDHADHKKLYTVALIHKNALSTLRKIVSGESISPELMPITRLKPPPSDCSKRPRPMNRTKANAARDRCLKEMGLNL